MDKNKNYKVYKITEKSTGNICFIGKTKKTLNNAFLNICNARNESPITELINNKGRLNFEIASITDNLSLIEASDLEKKLIRKASRKYKLYNQKLYQDMEITDTADNSIEPDVLNVSKSTRKNQKREVRCVTTGEVFPSGKEACMKYHIASSSLFYALNKSNSTAGFDEDDNPLHWEYTDGNVKQEEELPYTVYIISRKLRNRWKPIYVGTTKTSLKQRLVSLYANKSSSIYELLNIIDREDVKIESYREFTSKKEALACSEELIKELEDKNIKLYNRSKSPEERKKLYLKKMIERSKEKLQSGLKVTGPRPVLCTNDKKVYMTISDACKAYQFDDKAIIKSCSNVLYSYNGKFFQRINPYNKPIKTDTYTLYALVYYGIVQFIFYSKYTVLNPEEAIEESNYYEEIKSMLSLYERTTTFNFRVLCHNIKTEEEAEKMRSFFLNVLKDYNNRTPPTIDNFTGHGNVICEETGESFPSLYAITDKYAISGMMLKRALSGYVDKVFSRILDKYLHVRFEDANFIQPYAGALNLYYIIYDRKPVGVIVTTKMPSDILPSFKISKKSTFYSKMQELGYENFSLDLVHTNIADKEEGKQLKQAHMNLLSAMGYELFSYL